MAPKTVSAFAKCGMQTIRGATRAAANALADEDNNLLPTTRTPAFAPLTVRNSWHKYV